MDSYAPAHSISQPITVSCPKNFETRCFKIGICQRKRVIRPLLACSSSMFQLTIRPDSPLLTLVEGRTAIPSSPTSVGETVTMRLSTDPECMNDEMTFEPPSTMRVVALSGSLLSTIWSRRLEMSIRPSARDCKHQSLYFLMRSMYGTCIDVL